MTYQEIIKNINVLLVDDDKDYLKMTETFLKQIGYMVDVAENGKEAIRKLNEKNYQILLLDFYMPDMNGEEVVSEVRKSNQEIIIILQTGFSGQNPPAEMLKKLNIQNYFDKTEGIARLELEIISAVRIVEQQNQIELTKYKTSTIGDLMTSIAEEIKQALLSVSGGIEAVSILSNNEKDIEKLKKIYDNNKQSLEKVDKILTSVLSGANSQNIITDEEIITIINAISSNVAKQRNVIYTGKAVLKSSEYLSGNVNDIIFIVCSLIKNTILASNSNDNVDFVLTEDEENWYFNITSKNISNVSKNQIYLAKKVISVMQKVELIIENNKMILKIEK